MAPLLAAVFAGTLPSPTPAQITGRTAGHGGVTLEYEQLSTGDPTVVLVHGWMCDRTYWREQRTALSAEFGVVLLDLGGHGNSTATRSDWSIESFARDVSAVLRALELEDVVLVGHSMGGPVVAEAALLEPDRVAAVIGVDTFQYLDAPWLQGDGIADLVSRLSADFRGTTAGFVRAMVRASPDSTRVSTVARGMTEGSPAVGVAATRSMFEWYRDQGVESLNALDRPVWTINSTGYVVTDVDQLSALVPGIEVRSMDGVGHFVMLDDPETFNRLLVEAVTTAFAAHPVAAQAPHPGARMYHSMTQAGRGGGLLVLGGATRHGWTFDLRDVWSFDPPRGPWEQVADLEPGDLSAAAFDAQSERVVALAVSGETWAYDPRAREWERMDPATAPSGRCGHRLVYDAPADRVILFGGFACTAVDDPMHGDTWAYDYDADRWEERSPSTSPPARIYHAMAWNPIAGRTVVWGGRVDDRRVWSYDYKSDTWSDEGDAEAPPGVRAYHTLTWEPTLEGLLVFGGLELDDPLSFGGTLKNDTWLLDLNAASWRRLAAADAPSPRSHHAAELDSASGRVLLYGGEVESPYSGQLSSEVWWFDPARTTWTRDPDDTATREVLERLERERLRALVEADMGVADRLHATDFELVTPTGGRVSKEGYLSSIATDALDYRVWEAEAMEVRLYGDVASIRYRDAAFEVFIDGEPGWVGRVTHTNLYELRDGRWQIVWSHASGGRAPGG